MLETDQVRVGDEDLHFQVMEYVDGPTLQQVLSDKGRLATVEALSIAVQIARALEEAHGKGVLHHDIKPKNIFIAEDEIAKVGDFGVASPVGVPTPRDGAALGTFDSTCLLNGVAASENRLTPSLGHLLIGRGGLRDACGPAPL